MPDFDAIYPKDDIQLRQEQDELLYTEAEKPCSHCGKPTHRLSINIHGYICSTECYDAYWEGFVKAFNS